MRKDGRLYRRRRAGETAVPGFLDDYAFLALGLVDLYEATFNPLRIKQAAEIADSMILKFHDAESGGFFFSSADNETLISESRKPTTAPNRPVIQSRRSLCSNSQNIRKIPNTNASPIGIFQRFRAQIEKYPRVYSNAQRARFLSRPGRGNRVFRRKR